MNKDNGKISVRQAMLICIAIFCSPIIRYIPYMTVKEAKQAAWLCPLIGLVIGLLDILVWCEFLKKYEKKSFVEITKDILGKILGNIVCITYFLWITILAAFYLRMYAERLVSTTMPHVDIMLIILVMLLVVGYVIKSGIVPLARMNELFFMGLAVIFIGYCILVLPEIRIKYMFPITYKDIFPIFKGSIPILTIFSYSIMIFIFNDRINHKGEFKKLSIRTVIILTIIFILSIVVPLGVLSAPILVKMPLPFISSIMQISLFSVIERIESGIIMFWVISDFMLIAVFSYTAIHMIRVSFNLSNVKPFLLIYILGIFFLSLTLAKSSLELSILSEHILTQWNIIMGFIVPTIIFVVGKIRKKVWCFVKLLFCLKI